MIEVQVNVSALLGELLERAAEELLSTEGWKGWYPNLARAPAAA